MDLGEAVGGAVSASPSRARRSGSPCRTVSREAGVAGRGFLGDGGDARGRQADLAAIQWLGGGGGGGGGGVGGGAVGGAQQRGLAGAIAADQADAAALVHHEVGAVQNTAPAEADGGAGDGEERHGGG